MGRRKATARTTAKATTKAVAKAAGKPSDDAPQHEHMRLDPRGDGMYSGTFRWLESKRFPALPKSPARPIELDKGWQGYLSARDAGGSDLVATATRDPSMLDALNFPVTLLHSARLLRLPCFSPTNQEENETHVLVIGASRKAEQRVYASTDYWGELATSHPSSRVNLYFIGPEVVDDVSSKKKEADNLTVHAFVGTFGEFQRSSAFKACNPVNTVIIGYNTGFGSFLDTSSGHRLLLSWLPDLYAIADSGIPAVFTCANDYCDMNGEFAVQSRVVGANLLLLPQQNPFSAASHLHEEAKQQTAWSRGSSFLYAVQGADPSRRLQLDPKDRNVVDKLQARLDADMPDLHLVDALGRHYYMGMVLTKDQASRCKALQPSKTPSTSTVSPRASSEAARTPSPSATELATPRYELLPSGGDNQVVVRVLVPGVTSPAVDKIVVNVDGSALTVLVQSKYLLRTTLPFTVDRAAPVGAELAPPYLLIAVHLTPRTH